MTNPETSIRPCSKAYVTKLSPQGVILYSTYFGGSSQTDGSGIGVDAKVSAVLAGSTVSMDLPTLRAGQTNIQDPHSSDPFVARLNRQGRLVYSS